MEVDNEMEVEEVDGSGAVNEVLRHEVKDTPERQSEKLEEDKESDDGNRASERNKLRDDERDRVRDRLRDEERDRLRDIVRDRERDEIRDMERDKSTMRELTATVGESEETELTIKTVFEVFKRISSIKTPIINSQLALPYNKKPVKNSIKFKEEYVQVRSDFGKIDGKKGKAAYLEEKERRTSLPFNWPESSPELPSTPPNPLPSVTVPESEEKILHLESKVKLLASELFARDEKIADLKASLKGKDAVIASLAKRKADVERKLQTIECKGKLNSSFRVSFFLSKSLKTNNYRIQYCVV